MTPHTLEVSTDLGGTGDYNSFDCDSLPRLPSRPEPHDRRMYQAGEDARLDAGKLVPNA